MIAASANQSVIDHSWRRGHSVASKPVGSEGSVVARSDRGQADEREHAGVNPADVRPKASLADPIRVLRRLACVFLCFSEDALGADSENSVTVARAQFWKVTLS